MFAPAEQRPFQTWITFSVTRGVTEVQQQEYEMCWGGDMQGCTFCLVKGEKSLKKDFQGIRAEAVNYNISLVWFSNPFLQQTKLLREIKLDSHRNKRHMTRYNQFYCYLFCSKGVLVGNWCYLFSIYHFPQHKKFPLSWATGLPLDWFLLYSIVAVTVLHGLVHVLMLLPCNF